jgi:hypothetical protein
MFEETIRALRRLKELTTVSVLISDDEEGYFDRACPPNEWLFPFKVLGEDWRVEVCDEEVFCLNCGQAALITGLRQARGLLGCVCCGTPSCRPLLRVTDVRCAVRFRMS